MSVMKAISVKQPWSWAILYANKPVENRDWRSWNPGLKFRGQCLLHAGRNHDALPAYDNCKALCGGEGKTLPPLEQLHTGGFVGVIEIVDVVHATDPNEPLLQSPWFFGPYGLVIRNPRAFPFVPAKGQLGFFDVDMSPELEHFVKEAA